MSVDLFKPYKIGKLELKNRFVRSPVGDTLADDAGKVTDESIAFYKKLAEGGVGLIEAGVTAISPHGLVPPRGGHLIDNDDKIPGFRKVTNAVHQTNAKIALQISHCGGSSDSLMYRGTALAVSSTPRLNRFAPAEKLGQPHRVMTGDEIEAIIEAFVDAAKRAVEAGFDAIELHGQPRYLFGQFLSPLFNMRTDKWGGNTVNRRRFHLEVIGRIRQAIGPDFPVTIKTALKERDGGFTLEEGLEMCQQMVAVGLDGIEVSGIPDPIPGIQGPNAGWGARMGVDYAWGRADAAALKRAVTVPVMLVGGIRSFELAQSIVDNGDADMISLACPLLREPELINRWQKGDRKPAKCITCDRCHGVTHSGQKVECGEEARLKDQSGI